MSQGATEGGTNNTGNTNDHMNDNYSQSHSDNYGDLKHLSDTNAATTERKGLHRFGSDEDKGDSRPQGCPSDLLLARRTAI